MSEKKWQGVRHSVYAILAAFGSLAVALGYASEHQIAQLLSFSAQLLTVVGVGMAWWWSRSAVTVTAVTEQEEVDLTPPPEGYTPSHSL